MKHRILILADGASGHTTKWIEGLSLANQFEIHLLSMNPNPSSPDLDDFPIKQKYQIAPKKIRANGGNYGYLLNVPQIRRLIREIKPALISTLYLTSYGFMGALVKGNAKMVHFTLGSDVLITADRSFLHKCIAKFALARADFVISPSSIMTGRLVDRLGYPQAKILTQQYGITDRVINYPKQRREYDIVSNRQWVPNSNLDYLLEILSTIGPVRTALVGRSSTGNEALGEKLEFLSQKLKNCVVFSHLPYDQNIDLVAKSRFLVSVTTSDGASLSVMEGMAVGTVPILSDIPANREWVQHGVNGFLVPLGDAESARKIIRDAVAMGEDEREVMANNCRRIIEEKGSLTRNMKRVSEMMMNIIEPQK